MSFSATVSDRIGGVRLLLRGEIYLATRDSLRHALRSAFRRTSGVIEVDLREVTFLDCAGVGAIVEGHQVAGRAGLTLIVTHDHGIVRPSSPRLLPHRPRGAGHRGAGRCSQCGLLSDTAVDRTADGRRQQPLDHLLCGLDGESSVVGDDEVE